ncbi:MAG: hypothetical protein ACUVUE_03080 [Candidatus Bathycorpusculaceae bacterium]
MSKIVNSAALQKHILISASLASLILTSFITIHMALFAAFVFTFLVPGLMVLRFFRLKSHEVMAFIPIFSVMTSTFLIYCLSLLFGYSREMILGSFLILTAAYAIVNLPSKEKSHFKDFWKIKDLDRKSLSVFLFVFILSLTVLCKSVWFESENGIVITGSNWQDTPLHYEIIESINAGNFPPEMPYYSGVEMSYHYFIDFHTAILEKVYGFMPKLLPISNAIFILVFALSIYSLAKANGEREALFSTILATFGWGFSYFILLSALLTGEFNPASNYTYQYNGFFGLPPIFDNLLQQRPLLIGLPAFAFVLNLVKNLEDRGRIVLAGIITGLLFPFHVISFLCCFVAYFIMITLNLKDLKPHYSYFLVSIIIASPFVLSASHAASLTSYIEFGFFSFLKENPVAYYLANLGIPFLVSLIFLRKVEGKLLKGVLLALFLIPNIVAFTPNPWDMYKFFNFTWIPISVLSGTALARIRKDVAILLLLLSILASASVIVYNVSTNYIAASWDEFNAGIWIRNNTEEKAVFLTYYSIHSPPTMIGGRLRVLSYLNWPYGHGIELNEIWNRMRDVDSAYTGNVAYLEMVIKKYDIKYIYVGEEESENYPKCIEKFDNIEWLKLVYNERLKIYKIIK